MNRLKGMFMTAYEAWLKDVDDLPLAKRLWPWATALMVLGLFAGVGAVWVMVR